MASILLFTLAKSEELAVTDRAIPPFTNIEYTKVRLSHDVQAESRGSISESKPHCIVIAELFIRLSYSTSTCAVAWGICRKARTRRHCRENADSI